MKNTNNNNRSRVAKALSASSTGKDLAAFWARHRQDTFACIEGRLKPEFFLKRYGHLPRIVQRRLDRQNGRRFRR